MKGLRRRLQRFDIGFLVVLIIALLAIWPFLSRASLPQETDTELHVFRLHELSYLIQNGENLPALGAQFLPRLRLPHF